MQPAVVHDEVVHLQLSHLHLAAGYCRGDRADAHQLGQSPPREGKVAAVVAEGDLGEEAVGGGGLPRDVGRRVRRARLPVHGLQAFADRVAEVLCPFLRDLREVPHAPAVALGPAMAQLVRASQAARGGYPHIEPVNRRLRDPVVTGARLSLAPEKTSEGR